MATIEAVQTTPKATGVSYITFNCNVQLADSDRILIEAEVMEFDSQKGQWVQVKRKFRLEELIYHNDSNARNHTRLSGIKVRGFRKDGALKARTQTIYRFNDELLAQIPDHFHDPARKMFLEAMNNLLTEIREALNKGVQI